VINVSLLHDLLRRPISHHHSSMQCYNRLYPVYTMKLARRARDERSWSARRAGLMSWLSAHLNGVILQTFTKLLVERSSCAHRVLDELARRALVEPARRASFIV